MLLLLCGKALQVTQEVNCVTDFIYGCEQQIQEVKKQKEKGLLYGIPVSIKDHIGCKVIIPLYDCSGYLSCSDL